MLQSGKSRSSSIQALSAIRKLAAEAADNGLVPTLAYGLERVKSQEGKAGRRARGQLVDVSGGTNIR